jgi:hypothetical protein
MDSLRHHELLDAHFAVEGDEVELLFRFGKDRVRIAVKPWEIATIKIIASRNGLLTEKLTALE